ncbi:hypothetical protein PAXINDRAFT_17912 [Paxillus involutus ATCC 200175]|uniref:Uncharacterized protein n=1 Tax=Paxillus involutus ATCC 200175 TaxID=664439 RepID=A0A0C9T046_PAXIN|nr:hypothetical protein PAXINDRAFT_17912 [Paxillus involutus ATCC 200175]
MSVLRSHRPVSKFVGRRAWKSLWHPSRGDHPEITTVYAAYAPNPHVAAADPDEPAKPPPKSETVPGNYATHAVLPPSPPHTPTDDTDDDVPNDSTDDHTPGAFCGLCSRLFPRRSTARPNDPGDPGSGIEMAELHGRTEDEATSATATSSRLVINTTNPRESSDRGRIDHPSAHDTAIEVECLPIETERLRIEAQEKEAAASRAHELLVLDRQIELLDRQIELARIHAGYPAPGRSDPRQG